MKSETWTIHQVFQDRKQYKVPFYQRAYVWTLKGQWELLWADIEDKANERLARATPAPHFLGAIVVEPQERTGLKGVDTLHIIDGQQRLTTLQYVLAGIRLATRELGIKEIDSFLVGVLDNPNRDTMAQPDVEVFKVWPTFSDQKHFIAAMTAEKLDILKVRYPAHFTQAGHFRKIGILHPGALEAVWNFADWAKAWIARSGPESAEYLVEAVLKDLKVVLIQLEKGDDAQVIFETLNGRGAELHATDLIRNHLFMSVDQRLEDPASLYEAKWKQFEQSTWKVGERRGRITRPRLEWLIFSAVRAETGQEGDLGRLYVDFKNYAQHGNSPLSATQQLDMLDTYAKHYLELISGNGDLPIARFGRRLMPYDTTTTHPLALRISTADIESTEKTAMFNAIVSYIVRRNVCGLTAKNYNNWFISILRQWIKGAPTAQALKDLLASSPGSPAARWPDDAEFAHAIQTAPTYYGNLDHGRCKMFLTELEGFLRISKRTEEPTIPDLSNLDIDHILPRSWYDHWTLPDGSKATFAEAQAAETLELSGGTLSERYQAIRRRAKALPTLGNLTLLNLSVNREAQNAAFRSKTKLLIENTNLTLNVKLHSLDAWDEDAIMQRAKWLAEAAVQIYPR
jgi:hypothetical protein